MNKEKMNEPEYRISYLIKLSKKVKKYRLRMALAVLSGLFYQLSTIAIAGLSAYIVGIAIEGRLLEQANALFITLAVLIVLRTAMCFSEMWVAHDVAFKVLADFRVMLYDSIEKVSPAILLNMRSGQLASTLMSDVELLEWFFAHTFGSSIIAIIVPLILLIFLGTLNLLFPCILLLFLVILVRIPFVMRVKGDEQGLEVRDALGEANAVAVEGVQGLKEILTLNYLDKYRQKNRKYMQKLYQNQLKYSKRLGTEGALIQIVVGMAMVAVMALAAYLVLNGRLDFSWFTVVVMISGMLFAPVIEICNTARNLGLIFAAAYRVFLVIEKEPLVEDDGENINVACLDPEIKFSNVTFAYNKNDEPSVKNLNFSCYPGEQIALVGESGAGKSTCINLLLRYWDPDEGCISIGGRDIKNISLENLHEMISVVLQDVYLFNGSIYENIRLGSPDATKYEIEEAAKTALAHEFIINMSKGYDTFVGERGSELSGGQRQRIAIARAVLKNTPILLLDEAVSNLDTENEKEIQKTFKKIVGNQITLIVAHRLSTIIESDRLIVIKDGKIVEIGSHNELLKKRSYYANLIKSGLADSNK